MQKSHSLGRWALGFVLMLGVGSPVLGAEGQNHEQRPAHEGEGGERESSTLLPDWHPEHFDLIAGPILGGRSLSTEANGEKLDTISSEIGLSLRLKGIPIIPGNPGISLDPYGSYTWGNRTEKARGDALNETDSSGFHRYWYGLGVHVLYHAFAYTLDVGHGQILFDDKKFIDLTATRISHDFGLLLLPFLSTHYTLTSYDLTEQDESSPSIEELDHWIHEKMFFSMINFNLDLGPGFTHTKYSGRADATAPFQKIADVNTTYLKALLGFRVFWKLGISGSWKYILSADKVDADLGNIEQLPNQSLNENRTLANLPKGSTEATVFIGLHRLFGGLGIGWQLYYLEVDRDSEGKQISRDQGIVVNYTAEI